MTATGYIRAIFVKEDGTTIRDQEYFDRQKEAIEKYAAEHGCVVRNWIEERAKHVAWEALFDSPTDGVIIVYSADRVTRDVEGFIKAKDDLATRGVELLTVEEIHPILQALADELASK